MQQLHTAMRRLGFGRRSVYSSTSPSHLPMLRAWAQVSQNDSRPLFFQRRREKHEVPGGLGRMRLERRVRETLGFVITRLSNKRPRPFAQ